MDQMKKEELEITISDSDRIECAIRHIQTAIDVDPWAVEIAVEAMKTQLSAEGTTFDLISRQVAIDRINKQREHLQPDIYPQDKIGDAAYRICAEFIERLPSAQPESEERKEESAQNVPKEDLISRKEAIEAECEVCQIAPKKERGHNCTYYVHGCKEIECLRALPSAQPEPCEDAVSREAAIDAALSAFSRGLLASPDIRKLPSVQPERKKGKWQITDAYPHNVYCSECHTRFAQTHWSVWEDGSLPRNFCPNCGSYNGGDDHDL